MSKTKPTLGEIVDMVLLTPHFIERWKKCKGSMQLRDELKGMPGLGDVDDRDLYLLANTIMVFVKVTGGNA